MNITEETDKIQAQFLTNREAALKSLLTNPADPYLTGQADALGIPFVSVAKLVAHGMAVMLRDLAMSQLKARLDAEPKDKVPEKTATA